MEFTQVIKNNYTFFLDQIIVDEGVTKAVNLHINVLGELTEEDIKKFWGIDISITDNRLTLQTTKNDIHQNTARKMTLPSLPNIKRSNSKASQSQAL